MNRNTNYTAEIIKDKVICDKMFAPLRTAKDQKTIDDIYQALSSSIKFRLPDGGTVLGLDWEKTDLHLLEHHMLPYKLTTLEYYMDCPLSEKDVNDDRLGPEHDCRERVLLCGQVDSDTISMCQFFKVAGFWAPFDAYVQFKPLEAGTALNVRPLCSLVLEKYEMDVYSKHVMANYGEEVSVMVDVLAALSCKNVLSKDCPTPKHINKKREKKGKVPFYTYKTLVLDQVLRSAGSKGGTHASPRVHLRRGHIRRLPKGNIWVNSAVVGDKSLGMVAKDYALK